MRSPSKLSSQLSLAPSLDAKDLRRSDDCATPKCRFSGALLRGSWRALGDITEAKSSSQLSSSSSAASISDSIHRKPLVSTHHYFRAT